MKDVSIPMAFFAGLLSFLSPCVLPLVPSYISYITGISFKNLTSGTAGTDSKRIKFLTLTNSLAFTAGFSAIFISLGASSSLIGRLLYTYQEWIRIGGGILVILFGLFISGIIKLKPLLRERKYYLHGKPAGYLGSFFIGMTFAAGWTPCIGPVLGTILLYAASEGSTAYGIKLLSVYSLGLALPFLLSSVAINAFLISSKVIYRFIRLIMFLSGLLLIIFGIMLLSNKVIEITRLFPDIGIPFP